MVLAKGAGLYTDIGKKARGEHLAAVIFFYKDYLGDQKFTLTTNTENGLSITSTGIRKSDQLFADISAQLKNKNITTDIKVDANSKAFTTITFDEPAPGVKAIFNFVVPDQRSGKVELQYWHELAGISTSLGMAAKPIINFSGVAGNHQIAFGTDVSFDTATGNFAKYNTSLSLTNADLIATLALNDKGQTITASYFHMVSPQTNVGAELTHSFSTNENILTFGTQHSLDSRTTVKTRVNSHGKTSALIQHQCCPKSVVTISGEVDARALENSAKVGLCVAMKP